MIIDSKLDVGARRGIGDARSSLECCRGPGNYGRERGIPAAASVAGGTGGEAFHDEFRKTLFGER